MVVERDAGQRRDVNLELRGVRNRLREQRVQRVYALDDEHAVALQLQLLTVILAFSCNEVILRNLYAFARHQTRKMVFQQVIVHRLDVVEVIVAVGK